MQNLVTKIRYLKEQVDELKEGKITQLSQEEQSKLHQVLNAVQLRALDEQMQQKPVDQMQVEETNHVVEQQQQQPVVTTDVQPTDAMQIDEEEPSNTVETTMQQQQLLPVEQTQTDTIATSATINDIVPPLQEQPVIQPQIIEPPQQQQVVPQQQPEPTPEIIVSAPPAVIEKPAPVVEKPAPIEKPVLKPSAIPIIVPEVKRILKDNLSPVVMQPEQKPFEKQPEVKVEEQTNKPEISAPVPEAVESNDNSTSNSNAMDTTPAATTTTTSPATVEPTPTAEPTSSVAEPEQQDAPKVATPTELPSPNSETPEKMEDIATDNSDSPSKKRKREHNPDEESPAKKQKLKAQKANKEELKMLNEFLLKENMLRSTRSRSRGGMGDDKKLTPPTTPAPSDLSPVSMAAPPAVTDMKIEIPPPSMDSDSGTPNSASTPNSTSKKRKIRHSPAVAVPLPASSEEMAYIFTFIALIICSAKRKELLIAVVKKTRARKKADFLRNPVTKDVAPDFAEVIYKPMDLTTLEKLIQKGDVKTVTDLYAHMMRMFHNSQMYNKEGTEFHTRATSLRTSARQDLQDALKEEAKLMGTELPKFLSLYEDAAFK